MKEGQLSQHVWQGDFLSGDKAPNGSGEANEVQFALALMDYVHTPNMTYLCLVPSHWNKLSISTPLLYIPLIGDCQSAFHRVSGLVHDSSFCLLVGLTAPPPSSTRHSPIHPSSSSITNAILWQFPPMSGGCIHSFAAAILCICYCWVHITFCWSNLFLLPQLVLEVERTGNTPNSSPSSAGNYSSDWKGGRHLTDTFGVAKSQL